MFFIMRLEKFENILISSRVPFSSENLLDLSSEETPQRLSFMSQKSVPNFGELCGVILDTSQVSCVVSRPFLK